MQNQYCGLFSVLLFFSPLRRLHQWGKFYRKRRKGLGSTPFSSMLPWKTAFVLLVNAIQKIPKSPDSGFWKSNGFLFFLFFFQNEHRKQLLLFWQQHLLPKKPETLNSSSQHVVQGNTSALDITSTSAGNSTEYLENRPADDSMLLVEKMVTEPTDDVCSISLYFLVYLS